MTCDKKPIRQDLETATLRCELRKGHKGMCQRTYVESWWGKVSEEITPKDNDKLLKQLNKVK